ncbi:MAG: sodium:solute symporter family protein [bacterium]
MSVQGWTYFFVGASFAIYLGIAWLSRVRDTKGFYVAGRGVPAIANGMATAADWMSAASFISMAGLISTMGFAGGVYLMGWTGGYVLLALLLAPYLRKFGHYTVPDFVGDRYDSNIARAVAVLCAIFVSFTYVAGQMRGVGVVFSRFLEVDINTGVVIGMAIVFIYATLGGMKGITWTQVAQYWVLISAYLIPALAISFKLTGKLLPQSGLGATLDPEIAGAQGIYLLEKLNLILDDLGFSSYTETFVGSWDKVNVFCVALALMVGTAGLPHVIVRFYTVKSVKAARWSAMWALFFISLLYLTAPATAAFARYYMIQSLNGKTAAQLPSWYSNWEKTGLILWLDDGDSIVRYSAGPDNEIYRSGTLAASEIASIRQSHQRWLDTGIGADGRTVLRAKGLSGPDQDIIVLATPEMAELADWIIALVAAGGLAAALSTASGLLLVISSSVAHDLYYRVLRPTASEKQRLLVGRAVIGLAVVIAGLFGIYPPGFVSQVVAFAFGLAAASFFPAIVLGIFSKRVGTVPAVCGMVAGIGFTAYYIIACVFFDMAPWTFGIFSSGINPQGIGTIGMLLNFAVTLALTPLFPKPGEKIQDMVDAVREPEGPGPAVEIEEAPEH